jgi:hypothetical protein
MSPQHTWHIHAPVDCSLALHLSGNGHLKLGVELALVLLAGIGAAHPRGHWQLAYWATLRHIKQPSSQQ